MQKFTLSSHLFILSGVHNPEIHANVEKTSLPSSILDEESHLDSTRSIQTTTHTGIAEDLVYIHARRVIMGLAAAQMDGQPQKDLAKFIAIQNELRTELIKMFQIEFSN